MTLELTSRCNLRCRHCYLGDSHTASQELGFLQWKEILAQVIEAGCLWMSVTGGDPLLSPDFDRVYRYLVEQGVAVTVLTNGTNISEAVIDLFRELPPEKVEVSIYGATARTYEDVTRSPGSYRRFRQGVELLAEAGVNTELKAILLSLNAHQLKKMGAYAASVGSFFRFTGEIHSCLNGNPEPNRWRLKPKAVAECDFSDEERAQGIVSAFRNRTQPSSRELYRCGAGKSGFHLTSRGELQPCIMETAISFDLRHNLLADVWANQVPTAVAGDYSKEAHCPRCEYFSTCKICPPRARIATGREQEADLYLCALAEARDRLVVAYSEGGEKVET